MQLRSRGFGLFCFCQHTGIGFLHHLLAKVHADQIVLENVVIEHVFGGFTQVDDPFRQRRRGDAKRHVLSIVGAGGVIVATDSANAAGNKVRVAGIFTFHEDAVAAKDGRRAVTLRHLLIGEVDFGKDPQTAHYAGDRVPVHLH